MRDHKSSKKRIKVTPPNQIDLREDSARTVGQDPNEKIRPLVGGIQLAGDVGIGTLGVIVYDQADNLRILTAGHVCGDVNTLVYQPDDDNPVGLVETNGNLNGSNIDVASVSINVGIGATYAEILGTLVNYSFTQMANWPEEKQPVMIQGVVSGASAGVVVYPNATITFNSQVLTGVSLANYGSAPGDSGAPVVSIDGEDVTLLGIHGGSVITGGVRYSWFTPIATIETLIGEIS